MSAGLPAALPAALLAALLAGCSGAPPSLDAGSPRDARIEAAIDAAPDARAPDASTLDGGAPPRTVLAFSRTTGFRHASIGPALAALTTLADARGWILEHTEDPSAFTDASLARYDAIVFLLTTGDVLDDAQQAALERWVRAGGGWVGVHSASDTEYDWPFYGRLVGAWFARHPAIQTATLHVEDREHASTRHLAASWVREDEWYDFRTNPRPDVDVLLTVDESTYEGGGMGTDHPIAWHHAIDAGRAFYTGLGHTDASWSEPALLEHVAGGIEWAAGAGAP